MDSQFLFTVFFAIVNVAHNFLFVLFLFCFLRILFAKNAPYSYFYIASITLTQALYNGCSVMDIQNWVERRAGLAITPNEFLFTLFGWDTFFRVLTLAFTFLLYYQSYVTWNTPVVEVDFTRIYRYSNLTSIFSKIKTLQAKRV